MPLFNFKLPATLLPVNRAHAQEIYYIEHINNKSSTASLSTLESRPGDQAQTVAQTRYVDMLLGLDSIPRSHNLLASFSTWILLAGFLLVPGTFTSIQKSDMVKHEAQQNAVANEVLEKVKHASLLWIAFSCCVVGASGLMWLWWRWRSNYIWLINKIFL